MDDAGVVVPHEPREPAGGLQCPFALVAARGGRELRLPRRGEDCRLLSLCEGGRYVGACDGDEPIVNERLERAAIRAKADPGGTVEAA